MSRLLVHCCKSFSNWQNSTKTFPRKSFPYIHTPINLFIFLMFTTIIFVPKYISIWPKNHVYLSSRLDLQTITVIQKLTFFMFKLFLGNINKKIYIFPGNICGEFKRFMYPDMMQSECIMALKVLRGPQTALHWANAMSLAHWKATLVSTTTSTFLV